MRHCRPHQNITDFNFFRHQSSLLYFKKCLMALRQARDRNGNLILAESHVMLEIAGCYIMRNVGFTNLYFCSSFINHAHVSPTVFGKSIFAPGVHTKKLCSLQKHVCFSDPSFWYNRISVNVKSLFRIKLLILKKTCELLKAHLISIARGYQQCRSLPVRSHFSTLI